MVYLLGIDCGETIILISTGVHVCLIGIGLCYLSVRKVEEVRVDG